MKSVPRSSTDSAVSSHMDIGMSPFLPRPDQASSAPIRPNPLDTASRTANNACGSLYIPASMSMCDSCAASTSALSFRAWTVRWLSSGVILSAVSTFGCRHLAAQIHQNVPRDGDARGVRRASSYKESVGTGVGVK